jgi:hypothetical protein
MCGYAKTAGQLKKDQSLMYYCSAKFPFDYFIVKNKDNKFVRAVFNQQDYILKENEYFEKVAYPGCPFYRKNQNDESFI